METIIILTLGIFVGSFSALLGVGGGILIVPLLPMVTLLTVRETIATSLLAIFLVVLNNTLAFHRKRQIEWPVALQIGPMTAIGSFASGYATRFFSSVALLYSLGALLLIFVWRGLQPVRIVESKGRLGVKTAGVGLLAGLASGISGVGSGVILSPFLLSLRIVKHTRVSPTANAIMCFTTFFGVLSFFDWPTEASPWVWGLVHGDKSLLLVCGALLSSHFARSHQHRIPEAGRRRILMSVLVLLAVKVFWNAYSQGH